MNLKNSLFIFLFVILLGCKSEEIPEKYLIELDEFETLSKLKSTKIIDFRKLKDFKKGHLNNAINVWRTDIEDSSFPYGGMKVNKKQLEKLFSRLGIENDDTLLLYDDKGLCDAARLWWVLQYYNFKNVKLLNGGLTTIKNASIPLTKENHNVTLSKFKFTGTNTRFLASKEQIQKAINNNSIIIDTRTEAEFLGKYIKKGAFKSGKIPTSKLIDWANAIDYNESKKLKTVSELEVLYKDLPKNKNDTIYVYCHSGVRSAHTTFVLTQVLGYKNILNYDGSWTEWSYNDLPIENNNTINK
jgi:thiosulfate/3-mercaptopyruvate sulfurtransferase